jgi:hypothetical protein
MKIPTIAAYFDEPLCSWCVSKMHGTVQCGIKCHVTALTRENDAREQLGEMLPELRASERLRGVTQDLR